MGDGITKPQIKKIKTLQSKLGIADEQYRLLLSDYWVESCTKLTEKDAAEFIGKLEAIALDKGVWKKYATSAAPLGKRKYDSLGMRTGMASPRQLRMVEVLWKNVSFTHDKHKQAIALRRFIFRIAGVDDLVFLTSQGASKVINAIQSMKGKHGHGRSAGTYKDRSAGGF
ncbi:MAG: DUF1018 domain-containing protein [Deltaproteobacteria bacterium]|nr:DUF1018 domain-containing protein [Deltaproteobacteria bacterium]